MIELEETFESAVRDVLEHLWEPSFLRQSPLLTLETVRHRAEQRAFPPLPTHLIQALRNIAREAIDTLKPDEEKEQHGARRWRPYHVLHYAYWEEQSAEVVAAKLYVSRRTFFRDLNKAVAQLANVLHDMESAMQSQVLSLAKWVEAVPTIRNFVGREEEMSNYQQMWDTYRLIVIEGLAGVGKTSLGAELVRRYAGERPVFWYSFRHGINDDVHSVLLGLAAFLASNGHSDLWHFLQRADENIGSQRLNLKTGYLISSLQEERYVLCFDDFHVVDEDAVLRSLFTELQARAATAGFSLLIISRHTPTFVKQLVCPPLRGMNQADTRHLLESAASTLVSQALVDSLHEKTGGHPQLLNLFAAWAMGKEGATGSLQHLANTMPETREVRHYLLHNVYNSLNSLEQKVVWALSLLRPPISWPAIEDLLDHLTERDVNAALQSLVRKHVVEESTEQENALFFHPCIREFCYGLLQEDVRQEWHVRAGEHFEAAEGHVEAAYHYLEAGLHDRCAAILVEQAEYLISSGQCRPLLDLLSGLDQAHLTPEQWIDVCFVKGETLIHTATYEEALRHFLAVLEQDSLVKEQRALALYKLSSIHERYGEIDLALTCAKEGLALFEKINSPEAGLLSLTLAWLHHRRREDTEAQRLSSQAIDVLESSGEYTKDLGKCYRARGMIALALGKPRQAEADTRRGLEVSERIGDTSGAAMALNNLGVIALQERNLSKALAHFKQSLTLREEIGDTYGRVMSYANIGEVYVEMKEMAEGRPYLERALDMAATMGMRYIMSLALGNLAVALDGEGDPQSALEYLHRALEIAVTDGYRDHVVEWRVLAAQILRGIEKHTQALDMAQQALDAAAEIQDSLRQAKAYRALGYVLLDRGETTEAHIHLQKALDIARASERDLTEMEAEISELYQLSGPGGGGGDGSGGRQP